MAVDSIDEPKTERQATIGLEKVKVARYRKQVVIEDTGIEELEGTTGNQCGGGGGEVLVWP